MKLQDYAHYYIGCRCFNTWFPPDHKEYSKKWKLSGVLLDGGSPYGLENDIGEVTWTDSIKPILRKIEDMTKYECDCLEKIKGSRVVYRSSVPLEIRYDTPDTFNWMLKKQFDIFGLIDAGLAIDSKTLK